MRKISVLLSLLLLLAVGLYAQTGRVIADITYDIKGGSGNNNLRLVTYYSEQALAYDKVVNTLNQIRYTQLLNGGAVNIRIGAPVDANGKIEAVVTFDDPTGKSNLKYTVSESYDPKLDALNSVKAQLNQIKIQQIIFGETVTNLKIGDIKEVTGGYRADMTFDKSGRSNVNYHIDEFYDPKIKSRDIIEDQIIAIQIQQSINGTPINNLKVGDIKETTSGFTADLTYDIPSGTSNNKLTLDEFYDAKLRAHNMLDHRISNIKQSSSELGDSISNLNVGKVTDMDGGYSVTVSYRDNSTNINEKQVLVEFYDAKAQAVYDINSRIQTIKNQLNINGNQITNLKVGKVQIL